MKKSLLFFAILATFASAMAKPVEPSTASQVASHWLQVVTGKTYDNLTDITAQTPFHEFYVFTLRAEGGFILIAADDCVLPVLGYSETSTFPVRDMPAHVKDWMDVYEEQIAFYRERYGELDYGGSPEVRNQWNNLENDVPPLPPLATAVSPLVTTQWNQSPYYNNLCPYDNTYNERTVTGCVATAAAQIMKFWNHPATGYGSHSYTLSTYGTQSANFGATTYNWSSMPTSLSGSSSTAQVNAVATLMYHFGVAVEMDYGPSATGGSGALSGSTNLSTAAANNAFFSYFKYKPTLHYELKANYTDAQWSAMLQADLNSGHPILYSGRDPSGGHAFVCDGYNNQGQFHFNWGWGGSYDGYYTMGDLHPGTGGTGGNSTYTFNLNNSAILGIEPMTSWSTSASTTVNASATNTSYGSVTGGGTYNFADTITIRASANTGCRFYQWSDGSVQNPRTLLATGGTVNITANVGPLTGDTLGYSFNGRQGSLGNGSGNCYWGIKIPGSVVASGHALSAVEYFLSESGTYDLTIYTGTTSPTTTVHSQTFTLTDEGAWNTLTLSTPVTIPSGQNIWITLHDNGVAYPCSYSFSSGNADGALWGSSFSSIVNSGWDIAFMIRGIFTDSGSTPDPGPGPDTTGCNLVMTIGDTTSTSTAHNPINNYYKYSLSETIIDAAELQGLGQITSISYRYNHTSASTKKTDVSIWIQPTTKTAFSSNSDLELLDASTAVLVYSGALNCTQGWNEFLFTTPFNYDGTSNLMIIVDDNSNDYDGNSYKFNTAASSGYKSLVWYSDSQNPDPTNSSYTGSKQYYQERVQMRLKGCEPLPDIVTVADGTDDNSYVPVYGFYADAYLRCQTIYPATVLAATTPLPAGASITALTYYLATPASSAMDGTFTVKLTEVSNTTLSGFVSVNNATTVYTGTLDATGSEMTITFTTPYTYNGGNLLVEVSETVHSSNYPSATYQGVNTTGASWQGYSYSSVEAITGSGRDFMPKTTFAYTGGNSGSSFCAAPLITVDSVDGRTVWFSWSSSADSVYIALLNNDGQQIMGQFLSATGSVNGVYLPEQYFPTGYGYIYGAAFCGGTDTSDWAYDVFAVTCDAETQCPVTIVLNDGFGDGWNGGALDIYDTVSGLIFSSITCPGHGGGNVASSDTLLTYLCPGRVYSVVYRAGQYDEEVSFQIISSNGDTLINVSAPTAGVQGYFAHTCATQCTVTLPYTETFEEGSATLDCWTTDGPGTWQFGSYSNTGATYEGSNYAYIRHATSGNVTKLISPVINASANATVLQLTFAHIQKEWGGDQDELRVYYRTSATGSWVMAAEYTNNIQTWTVENVMIPNNTYQVAFEMTDGYGYGVAVDSVVFTEITTSYCYAVTGLTATASTYEVSLDWDDNNNDGATYTIYDGVGAIVATGVSATNYTVTNLTADSPYTFSVVANCSSTSASDAATVSTRTLVSCPAPTNLTATLTEGNTTVATLSWTVTGVETAWQICVNGDTNNIIYVTTNPYTLTGLTAEQTYTAQVRAYCDVTDHSVWSNTVTFEPTAKHVIGSGDATNSYLPTYTYYNYSLTQQIYTVAELGDAGMIESIDFYNTSTNSRTRNLDVYVVSTTKSSFENSSDWITVTAADLQYSGSVTFAPQSWSTITLNGFVYDGQSNIAIIVDDNTGSYESAVYFKAFDATSQAIRIYSDPTNYDPTAPSSYSGTVLDVKNQIRLSKAAIGECMRPTGVTVSYNGGTTATVSWNSSANVFNLSVNDAVINNVTNPYTLTGLNLATTYNVKVQTICTTGVSDWTNPVSFTTDNCLPEDQCQITIYAQDSWGDGWNGNTINVVQNGATVASYSMPTQNQSSTTIYDTAIITVCAGMPISFNWITGSYANEVSFAIANTLGQTVFSASGSDMSDGLFLTLDNCSALPAPDSMKVTVAVNDVTMGTTVPAPGIHYFYEDDTCSVIAVPNTGYHLQSWGLYVTYDGTTVVFDTTVATSASNVFDLLGGLVVTHGYGRYEWTVTANFAADQTTPDTLAVTFAVNNAAMGTTTPVPGTYYYVDGDTVYFSATPNSGYRFVGWAMAAGTDVDTIGDGYISAFFPASYFMAYGSMTMTALFEVEPVVSDTVFVTFVVDNPAMGTTIPTPGTYQYFAGDSVHFGSQANAGYRFLMWEMTIGNEVDTLDASYANGYFIYADYLIGESPVIFKAFFEPGNPDSTTITYAVNDASMGTTNPAPGTYTIYVGDAIGATAIPTVGHSLSSWTLDVIVSGTVVNSYTSTDNPVFFGHLPQSFADNNATMIMTANFIADSVVPEPDSMKVTVAVNNTAWGTTIPAPGVHYFTEGTAASVVAVPNTGYHLESWTIQGSLAGYGTWIDTTINYALPDVFDIFGGWIVEAGHGMYEWTVTANFAAGEAPVMHDSLTVITSVNDPAMGTITPAPGTHYYGAGDTIEFSIQTNPGYYIYAIQLTSIHPFFGTETETITDTADIADFLAEMEPVTVNAELYGWTIEINVIFAAIGETPEEYTVSVNYNSTMGTVSMNGEAVANGTVVTAMAGQSISFTANAYSNYRFVAWVDNGDTIAGGQTVYTINNIDANHSVIAVFEAIQGIDDIDMDNVTIYSIDNMIVVRGAEGKPVVLFDVNGRMLSREASAAERIEFRVNNSGVYLVKVANAAAKRVVVIR
ncbi:MAG: C10 family peptidase [Bacteroidales bacterium]|nr:C10 family peptidase [Bacteroidales bacterium]